MVMKHEHMDLVAAGEALDEPQQNRRDPFAAGAIETAGDNQSDAHAHQASHGG
jgi:hypothetical protein